MSAEENVKAAILAVQKEIGEWHIALCGADLTDRLAYAVYSTLIDVLGHLEMAAYCCGVASDTHSAGSRLYHVRKAHDALFLLHRAYAADGGIPCFNNGSAPRMLDAAIAAE